MTIPALAAAVEAKDENTKGHNLRVAEWAVRIGREMGLTRPTLRILARADLLHDVGKIGIPDAVFAKPGPLDDAEWKVIKQHPDLGVEIPSRLGTLRREAAIVHAHHERMDGSAYPRALRGDEIPARGSHHRGRRHLRCPHLRPPLPQGVYPISGGESPAE